MKFECDSCHAHYMIADEKVGKKGVKVKCKKCQHVIIVRPGALADAKAPPKAAVAVPDNDALTIPTRAPTAAEMAPPPPPPPPPDDDEVGQHMNATDPSANAFRMPEPPPAPPSGDADPTAAFAAPKPISMQSDATQLSQPAASPEDLVGQAPVESPDVSERVERPTADVRTELAAPPEMPPVDDAPLVRGELAPATLAPPTLAPPTLASPTLASPTLASPTLAPAAPAQAAAGASEGASNSAAADGGNELDDQIAGMFNAMFDESGGANADGLGDDDDDQRGPTRVLAKSTVDALRRRAERSDLAPEENAHQGSPLDLHSGPDPRQLEAGLVAKGGSEPSGADDGPAHAVWHVAIDDQDVGPLSLAEVGRHIESGRVDRDTLVWKMGMDDWVPAGEVDAVRALFNKVPMPRIARAETPAPRRSDPDSRAARTSGLDVGLPFDAVAAASPFEDESDPAWRPHGLTDVYQAANLAEAAVGGGLATANTGFNTPRTSSSNAMAAVAVAPSAGDGEWRPGAASALASLVNDEIKRLDQTSTVAEGLGPLPADDASINAPLFGAFANQPTLEDANALVDSSGIRPRPANGGYESTSPGMSSAPVGMAPAAYASQGYAPPSFATQAPSVTKNPIVLAGLAVGGLLVVLLTLLVVVTLMRDKDQDGPKVVLLNGVPGVLNDNGEFVPYSAKGPASDKPGNDDKGAAQAAKGTDADKPTDKPTEKATDKPTDKPGEQATDKAADDQPGLAASGSDTKIAANGGTEPDARTKEDDADPDAAARKVVKKTEKAREREKPKEKEKEKEKEKTVSSSKGSKDCDPVLDFDCKKTPTVEKKPPAGAKPTLSPADVLEVVKGGKGAIANCGKKHRVTGVVKMTWRVLTSGKTSDVQVADSKYAGTPVGQCMVGVVKGWKFPVHEKAIPPVSFPFKLE